MPGLTGLEAAPLVRERAHPPAVVFVTAHERYAIDAFAVEAFDYLLKPVDPDRLARVIERLQERSVENVAPVEKMPVVAGDGPSCSNAARRELEPVAAAALAAGFRTRWGRMVLEVLPPVDASKGTAVRALLEQTGLRRALYAGDDTTDLDGFARARRARARGARRGRLGRGPGELGERADVVVGSTDALRASCSSSF